MKSKLKEEKENKKAIVQYRSELGFLPLQGFTSREIDLFFGVCYKVQNRGTDRVNIKFSELRSLLNYKQKSNVLMIDELKRMSIKFSQLRVEENLKEKGFKIVIPFIDFEANESNGTFSVGVHPQFASLLNDIDPNGGDKYSLSDAIIISRFKSTYSKHCYKMLMNYRTSGRWISTIETFRYALCIPQSYNQGIIKNRILNEIKRDFEESGAFKKFEIIEKKESAGVGRPKVTGYVFEFELKNDIANEIDLIEIEGELHEIICPSCGRALMKINKKNGQGSFYGHNDFWVEDAKCKKTYSSIDEIIRLNKSSDNENAKSERKKAREDNSLLDVYLKKMRSDLEKEREKRIDKIKKENPDIFELYEKECRLTADFISMVGTLASKEEKADIKEKREQVSYDKKRALEKAGYDQDYLENTFKCSKCKDQCILPNGAYCECREERLKEAKYWNEK